MTGPVETGPKNYPSRRSLGASEAAVGPILEGEHSKKTYSELIEAYLGRTGWMRVTVGSLLDSGSDRGIFSCSSPTRFNEQEGSIVF